MMRVEPLLLSPMLLTDTELAVMLETLEELIALDWLEPAPVPAIQPASRQSDALSVSADNERLRFRILPTFYYFGCKASMA